MYIFKRSGATINSVIRNRKHAFHSMPQNWHPGELVLISKNRNDCSRGEKQIQFISTIRDIRRLLTGEVSHLWPGNEGRWKYLVELGEMKQIVEPFDLQDVLGEQRYDSGYHGVMTYRRLPPDDEALVMSHIERSGTT